MTGRIVNSRDGGGQLPCASYDWFLSRDTLIKSGATGSDKAPPHPKLQDRIYTSQWSP